MAFEDFKKAREEKSKAEKEARERAEEEARAAARHARMLQNQASEVVDGEEELEGLVRASPTATGPNPHRIRASGGMVLGARLQEARRRLDGPRRGRRILVSHPGLRGHVRRCLQPYSAVFTAFASLVLTQCSDYAAQYRLPP